MVLKTERVNLEKEGKAARDDATKFSKAVIAEEARLIALIEPEERRLESIQTAHDDRVAREKEARETAELERIERIQLAIQEIKDLDLDFGVTDSPAKIAEHLDRAKAIVIDERFQEFAALADLAKVQVVVKLNKLHAGALEYEAAQETARKEREELAKLRAAEELRVREAAEKEAAEIRRRAQEEAESKAAIAAAERASREKIEAEERAAREQREERDRQAQADRDAAQAKLDAERRALEDAAAKARREQEEQDQLAKLKQERLDAEKRALLETDDLIRVLRGRIGKLTQFSGIAKAIDRYVAKADAAKNQQQAA
jgi:hypothetical protein